MEFDLGESIMVLERTPVSIKSLLGGLSERWTHQNEGGDTWSPFDVVGHLIHGERTDWIPRTKQILFEENKAFKPFDRFAQFEESKNRTLSSLLLEFERLRAENLSELKSFGITDEDLNKEGIHPEFGNISLRQLLSAWVVHDLGHIVQVSRVMAKNYKEETGPWPKYLKVLN